MDLQTCLIKFHTLGMISLIERPWLNFVRYGKIADNLRFVCVCV